MTSAALSSPRRPHCRFYPAHLDPTPAQPRKLHLGYFALMEALVQGVGTRTSWNCCLRLEAEPGDTGTVRKTIPWLRDKFAAAAL